MPFFGRLRFRVCRLRAPSRFTVLYARPTWRLTQYFLQYRRTFWLIIIYIISAYLVVTVLPYFSSFGRCLYSLLLYQLPLSPVFSLCRAFASSRHFLHFLYFLNFRIPPIVSMSLVLLYYLISPLRPQNSARAIPRLILRGLLFWVCCGLVCRVGAFGFGLCSSAFAAVSLLLDVGPPFRWFFSIELMSRMRYWGGWVLAVLHFGPKTKPTKDETEKRNHREKTRGKKPIKQANPGKRG